MTTKLKSFSAGLLGAVALSAMTTGHSLAQDTQLRARQASPVPQDPRTGQLEAGEVPDQDTMSCREANIYVTVLGVAIECQPPSGSNSDLSRKFVVNESQNPEMGQALIQVVGDFRMMVRDNESDKLRIRHRDAAPTMRNLCRLVGAGDIGTCQEIVMLKWDYYDYD